ncbi:MAG: hypothetical protein FWG68_11625 [Defluviitaleaceae bacterium]|nr:hypothetical protein [Defluviitaleaceae bacterium]
MQTANSQTLANKKWQQKNREKARYLSSRSTARSFIKNHATAEDLAELQALINNRGQPSPETTPTIKKI